MKDFTVWAPKATQLEVVLLPSEERIQLIRDARGRFTGSDKRLVPGQKYALSLDGGTAFPDPRSELQPDGVHGPSCRVDFDAFKWSDGGFQQVPLGSAVIYELHIGTFSEAGTFEGAIARLDHLKSLGITHVEIMPVAHFPGTRGWGYDGVCLFAPHTAYGGPTGLHKLVDACHQKGLAVILDVVYNHLGPSGNYLGQYGPYFTDRYRTPWGEALNYDDAGSDEVRRFVCDNAKFWLKNYHIDGLRLDAIHAIFDESATHILQQLAEEVRVLSSELGRHLVLIAESGLNDGRIVRPTAQGGYSLDSQWSDDFHHALHCALTGEHDGYYADYGGLGHLASVLRHGATYRGQYSRFRDRCFGGDTSDLRGRQFVVSIQNHDQIGNRAVGDRLTALLSPGQLQIAAALTLLAPYVPMLFMGEEWGSQRPFQYFAAHDEPELREAVRTGRRAEFAAFGWDPEKIPDPGAQSTFENSKLDWEISAQGQNAALVSWYTSLLDLRRQEASLADDRLSQVSVLFDENAQWLSMKRGEVVVLCNLASDSQYLDLNCAVDLEQEGSFEVLLQSPAGSPGNSSEMSDLPDLRAGQGRSMQLAAHSVTVLRVRAARSLSSLDD